MIEGSKGLVLRDFNAVPRGGMECLTAVDIEPFSRKEIIEQIEIKKANKSRLSDIWKRAGIPILNQGSLGWCHSFGCANNIMLSRAVQNQPFLHLSPSSIAGPITNYQNRGMPIYAALERACTHGIADTSVYPELIQRNIWSPDVEKNAAKNKVDEHWDLQTYDGRPKSKGEQDFIVRLIATCLLRNFPVTVALEWWSHCVTYADVEHENGVLFFHGMNQWSESYTFGKSLYPGWFRFPEGLGRNTATPYEAYVCRTVNANSGK